ncbi:hypothetical protein S7711_07552 [Stachybotrys chartarum IBT 7711]|uniref:NWD NACHT-NTPase N-terminal domain-containing protein n=1 Tax=Stachybotrys chartarum (strain CBS 109288 / IBT 7711) TaxID=1280523 RepID=A0A084AN92_STACB|nr:hypothetical protein S7711_07552 [Stachybotrys chartarum IBT 7711]KFA46090.1 hypothetical protein S40293_07756 [Stachybotrys chartarum IBT 40293]
MSHDHENPLKRLVGRLRSNSHPKRTSPTSPTRSGRRSTSSSATRRSATPPSPSSHHVKDAPVSLSLWSAAYDTLRDRPATAGLVIAYEGIVAQVLPEHMKPAGINSTLRDHPDSRRQQLVTAIAVAGLRKGRGRGSSGGAGDEVARAVLDTAKADVEGMMEAYPSTALAWTGLCALTPLPLDPVLRVADMRAGVRHVFGRIQWYMLLSRLLLPSAWRDDAAFRRAQETQQTREMLVGLYRKVLEFEMNCVCAAASSWNNAAKNVVGWAGLAALVDALRDADAEVEGYVARNCDEGTKAVLLGRCRDLEAAEGAAEAAVPPTRGTARNTAPQVKV